MSHPRNTPNSSTFSCLWCRLTVPVATADGGQRNHCPSCLHSRHVFDQATGGPSTCRGAMSPIAIAVPRAGDWRVIHRCARCDELASDSVREDDNQLVVMRMAVRPLAEPPFPLEAFGSL